METILRRDRTRSSVYYRDSDWWYESGYEMAYRSSTQKRTKCIRRCLADVYISGLGGTIYKTHHARLKLDNRARPHSSSHPLPLFPYRHCTFLEIAPMGQGEQHFISARSFTVRWASNIRQRRYQVAEFQGDLPRCWLADKLCGGRHRTRPVVDRAGGKIRSARGAGFAEHSRVLQLS